MKYVKLEDIWCRDMSQAPKQQKLMFYARDKKTNEVAFFSGINGENNIWCATDHFDFSAKYNILAWRPLPSIPQEVK